MAKARKISEMKQLDLTRKHTERLRKGSHTKEEISNFIEQDVPNSDQALKLKHDIFTAHADYLDFILFKMQAINKGKEKMSFAVGSNKLITVYPHAKVIKKYPLKIETEYKAHKSYFIDDPELFDRLLEKEELKDMQELYNSKDINKKVMQEQRDQAREYWKKLKEQQGYSQEEIAKLFNTSTATIDWGIKQVKDQGIVWKYFNDN